MGQEDRAGKGKAGKGQKQAGKAASKPEKTNITLQEAAKIASGTMVGAMAGPAAGAMAKAATAKGKPTKAGKEQKEEKKKIEVKAKAISKAMGAIPIVNIAAATPAFEGALETMLRSMGEGLKTGAKASSEEEEDGFWTKLMVVMMESNERDLKIQGEMAVGFGKEMGDKGKNAWKFGGELWSFLKGENPEFPGEVWDAIVATGEGVVNCITHPKETMQALEEALSTATPEDMGRLLADFYVGQGAGVGVAGAVGKVKRVVNALETVSPNPSTIRAVTRAADEVDDASRGAYVIRNNLADRGINGQRTSKFKELTPEEVDSLKVDIEALGADSSIFKFNEGYQTGYSDRKGLIYVRGDVLPDLDSVHPRDLMSQRAVLAHEYYGHKHFGDLYGEKNPPPGSWNDEFRASYTAALNAPNLTDMDRMYLMLDALERAKEAGVNIKMTNTIRRILYGY